MGARTGAQYEYVKRTSFKSFKSCELVLLSQAHNKFDHPVAYLSRTLNKTERSYTTTEIECLACLYATT